MRHTIRTSLAFLAALTAAGVTPLGAQHDGLIAHPNVYKVQFENAWVRLIRVNLPARANLIEHTHPEGVMLHLYFNDAEPVSFVHDASPGYITRPAVVARSYRVGKARPETHAVVNHGETMSDYMRIELKTQGDVGFGQRVPTPPLGATTTAVVEVTNAMYRATRITIATKDSFVVTAPANEPALIVMWTDGATVGGKTLRIGDERFIPGGSREVVHNSTSAAVQLLRVDFLTKPLAGPP